LKKVHIYLSHSIVVRQPNAAIIAEYSYPSIQAGLNIERQHIRYWLRLIIMLNYANLTSITMNEGKLVIQA